ncbi:ribonuclease J [Mycoplasma testudineum]|uniref:Ribonuclease J n=1 Tax=Mycoplasma testudineum TaxID=244584 RepID=A0A4R6IE67_9MOLU|nr:ribonuclease J [Mycoplasma testudineum]OYD26762.1 ribonuclease J [Mycoplasma testudineum]TDO19898.1 ribonuclease J [Mycoplasma testudineum]
MSVKFFALGGLDENGKNCYIIENDNQIFIVNIGAKVPISTSYGVDTITPDITYLIKNKSKIAGLFITDTKNDSFSALPWFLMQIPEIKIFTSPFNYSIVQERISKYQLDLSKVELQTLTKEVKFKDTVVKPFNLFGSIPGSLGFNFETKQGSIIFMNNFVVAESPIFGPTNLAWIKKSISKNLLALVIDSGNVKYQGSAIDKIFLPTEIKEKIKKVNPNERIVIAAYEEEMTTLLEVLEIATETSRPIIVYSRSLFSQLNLLKNEYFVKKQPFLGKINLVNYKKMNEIDNAIVFVTSTVEVLYERFFRIVDDQDTTLKLKSSDNIFFIAPPINGIESQAASLLDKVAHITRKLTVVSESQRHQHRPAYNDIREVVSALKPKYVIPVQGLFRNMINVTNAIKDLGYNESTSIVLQNGKIAEFIKSTLKSRDKKIKEIGDQIVDGFGLGDVSSEVIFEREKLARDGVISIAALVDKEKNLLGKIHVDYAGLADKEERSELDELIKTTFAEQYYDNLDQKYNDLQKTLRNRIRKRIFKKTQKEPSIVITLYRI